MGKPGAQERRVTIWAFIAFVVCALGLLIISGFVVRYTDQAQHNRVSQHAENLVNIERLSLEHERKVSSSRAFLLAAEPVYRQRAATAREQFLKTLAVLRQSETSGDGRRLLEEVAQLEEKHDRAMSGVVELRARGRQVEAVTREWLTNVQPIRDALAAKLHEATEHENSRLEEARRQSQAAVQRVLLLSTAGSAGALVLAAGFLVGIVRSREQVAQSRAQRAADLVASEKRLSALVQSAMDAVITVDSKQRIVLFNKAAEQIFRVRAEEVIGTPLDQFIPARHKERHHVHIEEFGRTGSTSRAMHSLGRLSGIRADGEEFPLEATISHMNVDGEELYTVILRDVTKREQSEMALVASERLAERGRLAGTLAHEINNPLDAIASLAYLVRTSNDLNSEEARGQLKLLSDEIDRLTKIANQTLGLYRESQTAAAVRIADLVETVLKLYERKIATKGIAVRQEFVSRGELIGKAVELRQVISNLVINAIDAMGPHGTLSIRVEDVVRSGVAGVVTTITDTGSGIPAEHQAHIFEAFYSTKGERGTGIGLWVTSNIVQKHGGQISLSSNTSPANHGTTFEIFLPMSLEAVKQRSSA